MTRRASGRCRDPRRSSIARRPEDVRRHIAAVAGMPEGALDDGPQRRGNGRIAGCVNGHLVAAPRQLRRQGCDDALGTAVCDGAARGPSVPRAGRSSSVGWNRAMTGFPHASRSRFDHLLLWALARLVFLAGAAVQGGFQAHLDRLVDPGPELGGRGGPATPGRVGLGHRPWRGQR